MSSQTPDSEKSTQIPEAEKSAQTPDSDNVTHGIRIKAAAQYLSTESCPDEGRYMFAYRIVITNEGESPARLLARHWIILDAENHREDVRGPGVVGQMPHLGPGESFEYVSGCPLNTSWGTMEGTYLMEREDGEQFDAEVARFFLVPNRDPLQLENP